MHPFLVAFALVGGVGVGRGGERRAVVVVINILCSKAGTG